MSTVTVDAGGTGAAGLVVAAFGLAVALAPPAALGGGGAVKPLLTMAWICAGSTVFTAPIWPMDSCPVMGSVWKVMFCPVSASISPANCSRFQPLLVIR